MPYAHRLPALFVCLFLAFVPRALGQPPATGTAPPARVDRYGDPLPDGAVARLGSTRWRRTMAFGNLVLSPDGRTLGVDEGGRLALLDMNTGKRLHRLGQPGAYAMRPAGFSKDGKRFFSIEYRGTVRVWDVITGQEVLQYQPDSRNISAIMSANGTLLASYGGPEICLTAADTGKELRILQDTKAKSSEAHAISPDGKYLAGRLWEPAQALACVWEVATGKQMHTLVKGEAGKDIVGMAFSWDSRIVATGSQQGLIQLWDVATGQETRRFSRKLTAGIPDRVSQANDRLAFTRDNKLLISGGPRTPLRVWNIAEGSEMRSFADGSEGFVLLPDDRHVAALRGQVIGVWDITTGTEVRPSGGHQGSVWEAAFLKQAGMVASVGDRDELRLWDATAGHTLGSARGVLGRSTRFSPDGRILAVPPQGEQPVVSLRDAATGKELRHIPLPDRGPPVTVSALLFSGDGTRLAISYRDWTNPRRPPVPRRGVSSTFGVWRVADGEELGRRAVVDKGLAAFSPDGELFAVTGRALDGVLGRMSVELWNAAQVQPLYALDGVIDSGGPLVFSPTGRLLVASVYDRGPNTENDAAVFQIWEVATGQERGVIRGRRESQYDVAFSPDGRLLASTGSDRGSDSAIHLWDVVTGRELASWRGHAGAILCLAFSADGRYLVSGSADTTLLVWDMAQVPTPAPAARPSSKELEAAWDTLAGADAKAAHQAIHALTSAPDLALPLLRKRLSPAPPARLELPRWVKELDDARFEVRDKAGRELEKAGESAVPLLEKALTGQPSAELRRRAEGLLKVLRGPVTQPDVLRAVRAIEVLEAIGTADARQLLQTLAGGAPARQTREATTALQRLQKRATVRP